MGLYIGLMSGTSMDAIDAALVEFTDHQTQLIDFCKIPIPALLSETLLKTRHRPVDLTLEEYGRLDVQLGKCFAEAALRLIRQAGKEEDILAIGSHGQTILHQPDGPDPFTLQIGDANTIAALTRITTVADFRGLDLAVGGQGAPLTPAFHQFQFRSNHIHRVVLNIGGIANITILPPDRERPVTGFDTGPGNALLDDWAMENLGRPMDRDGQWAKTGKVHRLLLERLKADPYFQAAPPKSTGRDRFNGEWLKAILNEFDPEPSAADVQATLTRLTAETAAEAIQRYAPEVQEVLVCGGGACNLELIRALNQALEGVPVHSTARYGLQPECIEAVAFAWFAKCRLEGRTANLPSVTGASRSMVLGAVYAG